MQRVWGAALEGLVGERQGGAPANGAMRRIARTDAVSPILRKPGVQVMAVTRISLSGTQNPLTTPPTSNIMPAAPAHIAPGSERAPRTPILPRQMSGQGKAALTRRTEPRRSKGDDFLQRLRESGL
jgi:hypothetical protein